MKQQTIFLAAERDRAALAAAKAITQMLLLRRDAPPSPADPFPAQPLDAIAHAGLLGIAINEQYGGLDLSYLAQAQVFAALTEGEITSAFVASQHHACTTLMQVAQHPRLRDRWLPGLAAGDLRGANGFNFLNFPPDRAPMKATVVPDGFRLNGALPWVTAAHHSDLLVAGAVMPDGLQVLVAIPLGEALAQSQGEIRVDAPMDLMALAGSDTTVVRCNDYFVPAEQVILGPGRDVLRSAGRHSATYVPTAMTLGHARHCLRLIADIAEQKGGPALDMADWLSKAIDRFDHQLTCALTANDFEAMPILRGEGNALAAHAAHLALIAGGGTGYREGQLAQRLYREAGFFSVWSVSGTIIPETLHHLLIDR